MDRSARRALTKELGLEASYRILKFTTGSEHLHYGRFEPDIPRDFRHLSEAQDRYLDRLIERIPEGVGTILDVGAGSGRTAEILAGRGFTVECVTPEGGLASIVEARLAGRVPLHRSRFQDFSVPARYDLILFSESFQYIPFVAALENAIAHLNPGGHILIADFFSRSPDPPSPIRGGHNFARWSEARARYPLDIVVEEDITEETAPLHDIAQRAAREVIGPLFEKGRLAFAVRWPLASRIGTWIFRRDIEKFTRSRLATDRNAAEFMRAKIYKLYLFRLRPAA